MDMFQKAPRTLFVLFLTLAASRFSRATPLEYYLYGTFSTGSYAGGTFEGNYTVANPLSSITPNDTTDSSGYEALSTYNVVITKGANSASFNSAVNPSSSDIFSEAYQSADGGSELQFVSGSDYFYLYFAPGFNGVGPVLATTPKSYVSDLIVGSNYSYVSSGFSSASPIPEPGTSSLLLFGFAVVLTAFGAIRKSRLNTGCLTRLHTARQE